MEVPIYFKWLGVCVCVWMRLRVCMDGWTDGLMHGLVYVGLCVFVGLCTRFVYVRACVEFLCVWSDSLVCCVRELVHVCACVCLRDFISTKPLQIFG